MVYQEKLLKQQKPMFTYQSHPHKQQFYVFSLASRSDQHMTKAIFPSFFCPSFSISFLNWDEGIQQYPLHANIRPLFIQGSFIGKVFWILLNARKKVHYRRQSKNNTGFSELCSYIECCFAKQVFWQYGKFNFGYIMQWYICTFSVFHTHL